MERQRKDEVFTTFYADVVNQASDLTEEPRLPRYRFRPTRLDDGAAPHRFASPEAYHRQIYFQLLDLLVGELDRRFNQKLLEIPKSIERVLLASCIPDHKNCTDIDVPAAIKEKYSKDIDMRKLGHQLNLLTDLIQTSRKTDHYAPPNRVTTLRTLVSIFQDNPFLRKMMSDVENLLKIYLTIPITTSTAERPLRPENVLVIGFEKLGAKLS